MISFDTFLFGLMVVSTLTGLVTEAIKNLVSGFDKKIGSSAVAGIVAVVLSVGVSAGYMVLTGIAFSATALVYVVAMMFLSWLCAMIGYDKVVKVITQLKK